VLLSRATRARPLAAPFVERGNRIDGVVSNVALIGGLLLVIVSSQ
jgi:hypothetical protein